MKTEVINIATLDNIEEAARSFARLMGDYTAFCVLWRNGGRKDDVHKCFVQSARSRGRCY